ncbi:MAG: hypothetical protein ACE5IF_06170 [Candidatus Bathyarchaeia archaeon]
MSRSSVFRDVDKLSPRYVPKVLQHREDQMKFLSSSVRPPRQKERAVSLKAKRG